MADKTSPADEILVLEPQADERLSLMGNNAWVGATLFRTPVAEVPLPDAIGAWAALDSMGKAIEERQKEYRQVLLDGAVSSGALNDKGGSDVVIDGSKITNEKRQSVTPNEEKLKELMLQKGIKFSECFDAVTSLAFNPSKFDYLVSTGKFTEAELAVLLPVSRALKVKPNKAIKDAQAELKARILGDRLALEEGDK